MLFRSGIDVYVVPVSENTRSDAAKITAMLRKAGISCDTDIMGRKMGKAMKYASTVNSKFVAIVGKTELESESVTLRDMSSGEQKLVLISELVKEIQF